jgi:Zn finger protein HypA/HybF involved in hydrogenase expression
MGVIYTIWNELTEVFEYAGQTEREAIIRLKEHIRDKPWLREEDFSIRTMNVPNESLDHIEDWCIRNGGPERNKRLQNPNLKPLRAGLVQSLIHIATNETYQIQESEVSTIPFVVIQRVVISTVAQQVAAETVKAGMKGAKYATKKTQEKYTSRKCRHCSQPRSEHSSSYNCVGVTQKRKMK